MWQSVVVYVYDCLLYPTRTPNSYFQPNGPGVGGGGGFGGYNQVPQGGGGQHPLSLPTSNFNTNTNNPSTVLSSMTSPPHSISAHNANTVSICMLYCHQAGLETPLSVCVCFYIWSNVAPGMHNHESHSCFFFLFFICLCRISSIFYLHRYCGHLLPRSPRFLCKFVVPQTP